MITSSNLNSEKDLSRRIFNYYLDKFLDVLLLGNKDYETWYKDCLMTNFLMKAIHELSVTDGLVYMNRTLVGEVFFKTLRDRIREYLTYDLKQIIYADLSTEDLKGAIIPAEPPTIITYTDSIHRWVSYSITVASDHTTTVALPFNIAVADANSLMVTVNDHDPDSLVLPAVDGCHIIGTTLYWHNYYDLMTGDVIVIKFDKIA